MTGCEHDWEITETGFIIYRIADPGSDGVSRGRWPECPGREMKCTKCGADRMEFKAWGRWNQSYTRRWL